MLFLIRCVSSFFQEPLFQENSGSHNAATSHSATTYFFDIRIGAVLEGVQRMTDFIAKPLLRPNAIVREIRAVNSEHQMNKNRDIRRKWQIFYSGKNLTGFLILKLITLRIKSEPSI